MGIVVVGNPQAGSRTRTIAEATARKVADIAGLTVHATIDLADHARDLFEWSHPELGELTAAVASADFIVVASPTYKATYTGLLKAFLDRYGNDGLLGSLAIPVMTAADPTHGLAVETTLRPLLVELGAVVVTRGLFFPMSRMDELEVVVDEWAERNAPQLAVLTAAVNARRTA